QVSWAGFATLLAVAMGAAGTGLRGLRGKPSHRRATAWGDGQYTAYAAPIPPAPGAARGYAQLARRWGGASRARLCWGGRGGGGARGGAAGRDRPTASRTARTTWDGTGRSSRSD